MTWVLDSDRPIYTQIVERLSLNIVSGNYLPGQKIPSVRELALDASVNPNTMQKALAELERIGLVFSQRTSGRFITEDTIMIEEFKKKLAIEEITKFLEKMKQLGFKKEETLPYIEQILKEEP